MNKLLLLKMPDNRHFFTEPKHLPCLIEFGRQFQAEISIVHANITPLSLDDLALSVCNPIIEKTPEYQVLEVKLTPKEEEEERPALYDFIKNELIAGKLVQLSDLVTKNPDLARSTIAGTLLRVRRNLQEKKYTILRVKPGSYKIK